MKKKILGVAIIFAMLLSLVYALPASAETQSGSCGANGDNVTWTLSDDGTLTISGTGDMEDYWNSSSPFYNNSNIKTVVIEDGVTSIGFQAFKDCSSLTGITIPDSVTSIGYKAFHRCSSLTSVTIPNSVTSIGDSVFWGCTNLESIAIPDSVTSIGIYAFNGCTGLTEFVVGSGNKSYTSYNGVLFNKDKTKLVRYPEGKTNTSYLILDSVTSIGSFAFSGCTGLTSITIPDSVTSIGDWAFWDCTGLTSVTIPDSVTSIGDGAFLYCTGLESITIPDSVTSIGSCAFWDCTGLTSVTIPDSVTSIGEWAFSGCRSLTDVYYSGTESQWENIKGIANTEMPSGAIIHYNSTMPQPIEGTEPTVNKTETENTLVFDVAVESCMRTVLFMPYLMMKTVI